MAKVLTPEQVDVLLVVARAHGTTPAAEYFDVPRSTVCHWRQRKDGYSRGRGHPSALEMSLYSPRSTCFCPMCREWKTVRGLPAPSRWDLLEEVARISAGRPLVLITAVSHGMGVSRSTAVELIAEARRQGLIHDVRRAS